MGFRNVRGHDLVFDVLVTNLACFEPAAARLRYAPYTAHGAQRPVRTSIPQISEPKANVVYPVPSSVLSRGEQD